MSEPEFSRPIDVRQADGKQVHMEADPGERSALASRFGLVSIDSLEADIQLARKDKVVQAEGHLRANIVQSCAVSAEDLPVEIDEEISFRFVPQAAVSPTEEEIEIDADDCDEIEYSGTHFDLGEAVAQSLALAIDPFATGPDAESARSLLSDNASSPFAALAELKKRSDDRD